VAAPACAGGGNRNWSASWHHSDVPRTPSGGRVEEPAGLVREPLTRSLWAGQLAEGSPAVVSGPVTVRCQPLRSQRRPPSNCCPCLIQPQETTAWVPSCPRDRPARPYRRGPASSSPPVFVRRCALSVILDSAHDYGETSSPAARLPATTVADGDARRRAQRGRSGARGLLEQAVSASSKGTPRRRARRGDTCGLLRGGQEGLRRHVAGSRRLSRRRKDASGRCLGLPGPALRPPSWPRPCRRPTPCSVATTTPHRLQLRLDPRGERSPPHTPHDRRLLAPDLPAERPTPRRTSRPRPHGKHAADASTPGRWAAAKLASGCEPGRCPSSLSRPSAARSCADAPLLNTPRIFAPSFTLLHVAARVQHTRTVRHKSVDSRTKQHTSYAKAPGVHTHYAASNTDGVCARARRVNGLLGQIQKGGARPPTATREGVQRNSRHKQQAAHSTGRGAMRGRKEPCSSDTHTPFSHCTGTDTQHHTATPN